MNPLDQLQSTGLASTVQDALRRGCALLPGPVGALTPFGIGTGADRLDEALETAFRVRGEAPPADLRSVLKAAERRGYLIPPAWYEEGVPPGVRLERAIQLHLHFPVNKMLVATVRHAGQGQFSQAPVGVLALLNYVEHYAVALRSAGGATLLEGRIDPARPLPRRLASEQLLELILTQARVLSGVETPIALRKLRDSASPAVAKFFKRHAGAFKRGFSAGGKGMSLGHKLRRQFCKCCRGDEDQALLQLLASGDWPSEPPKVVLGELRQLGVTKPGVRNDVFERIAAFSSLPALGASAPNDLAPARRRQTEKTAVRTIKYDIWASPQDARLRLLKKVRRQPEWRSAAMEIQAQTYTRLLRHLLAPVLGWDTVSGTPVPRYVGKRYPGVVQRYQVLENLRDAEAREMLLLREKSRQLKLATTPEVIDRYAFGTHFDHPAVRGHWQQAVSRRRTVVEQHLRYRKRKLAEYGMTVFHGRPYVRDIYLDELLRIEHEVTPFVPFVKAAFRTALPIRTSVSFDPSRHAADGPEFDPDTLTQPDKYLRGEVMKTFRQSRRSVPVEQVNAFCLDYSRSMTHEPMRRLFKILFLLVLGLEDRASYDAIYFFDNQFYDVAPFGAAYTSRVLLFQMLQAVAQPNGMQLRYSGRGYTNIEQGIANSTQRIADFSAKLQQTEADTQIVRSLFFLTDGEPTGGIIDPDKLRAYIDGKREEGDLAIKGIYMDTGENAAGTIRHLFGEANTVATDSFADAAVQITRLIVATYREQRRQYQRDRRKPLTQWT